MCLPQRDGQAELAWMLDQIPRRRERDSNPWMVTHPSTNRTRRTAYDSYSIYSNNEAVSRIDSRHRNVRPYWCNLSFSNPSFSSPPNSSPPNSSPSFSSSANSSHPCMDGAAAPEESSTSEVQRLQKFCPRNCWVFEIHVYTHYLLDCLHRLTQEHFQYFHFSFYSSFVNFLIRSVQ